MWRGGLPTTFQRLSLGWEGGDIEVLIGKGETKAGGVTRPECCCLTSIVARAVGSLAVVVWSLSGEWKRKESQ